VSGALIAVRLTPRAGEDRIAGERDGVLLARVRAPAAEGRANEALCRLIARAAGVAPSAVTIARGARSREKLVRVEGMSTAQLRSALSSEP
jgi:uncharacterized protein YggU (UPF0235/DUF167 family)